MLVVLSFRNPSLYPLPRRSDFLHSTGRQCTATWRWRRRCLLRARTRRRRTLCAPTYIAHDEQQQRTLLCAQSPLW